MPTDSAFKAAGLEAGFTDAATMTDVEAALARGGEAGGADIAIVPLSSYVASYERLRALAPRSCSSSAGRAAARRCLATASR